MVSGAGIGLRNRAALDKIHRGFSKPFSVTEASKELKLSNVRARKLLSHLATGGWLSRVRRDLYSPVPLGATSPAEWRADPWVVAAATFSPGYIGGWTACEYWHFTDQLFRDIVVVTCRRVRSRAIAIQGTRFRLKIIPPKNKFGTSSVWRGTNKVEVSDPSRTIVDILNDPTIGGGVRHVTEVLVAYFESEHRNEEILLDYVERFGNRTIYKRLGYLAETLRISAPRMIQTCREKMSAGLSILDPSIRTPGKITKRWNLRVNVGVRPSA
jgi:predicted transcriptional regulator of viral defense system